MRHATGESKRALLLTDVTAPGGVDTYVCDLYRAATAAGWRVDVVIAEHPGSDALAAMLQQIDAPVTRAPLYHRVHDEAVRATAVEAALDRADPAVMHAVCGAPWTTVVPREVAVKRGVGLVFTEQYVAPGFTFEPSLHERIKTLYRRARAVIAVSRENARLLTASYGLDAGRMVVIPNPARIGPPPRWTSEQSETVRRRFALPAARFQAATVARCAVQKGLDVFIDAIALLPDEVRRQFHFTIFGDGPDRDALAAQAREQSVDGSITFAGWVDDAAALLPAFDLFVLPSRSEGMPFALIEALARALPVIATAVSGIPEALDDGRGGELVASESPAALADALSAFAADPQPLREKAKHGHAHVRAQHDADANLRRTVALWEES